IYTQIYLKDSNTYKQAFWFTIINYLGVIIGAGSTVFIYPYDKEFLGIVRYVDSMAQLLFPIMIFGGAQALIHFYPSLSEDNKRQLFKYGMTTILLVSLVILMLLVLANAFIDWENFKYLFYAFPIGFVLAFVELFKRQATNIEKLEIPTFYEKIIPKIALPLVFLLLIAGYFNVANALWVFIGSYFVLLLLSLKYLLKHYKLNTSFNFKSLFSEIPKREYYKYSFYSFLGSFASLLAFRIDTFMIPEFLSFEANGTFSIGVSLATTLA